MIGVLDIISALGFLVAALWASKLHPKQMGRTPALLLASALLLYAIVGIANALDHLGLTQHLQNYIDYLEVIFAPLFVFFLYAYHADGSMRKMFQAQEALRSSEEHLRCLVEGSMDAITTLDHQRRFTDCNQAFLTLFGYELDQLLGRSVAMIHLDRDSFRRFGEEAYPAIERQGYWQGEWPFRRFDGGVVPMESVTSVLRNSAGDVVGYVAVLRDMSQRKSLENQLNQAQKMEAVGTLAGGVAHDFNNILSVIMGYSELCQDQLGENHPSMWQLEQILAAAGRGKELVQQILTFSRRVEAQVRLLDLNREVKLAARLLKRTLPRMIEIDLELAPDLPAVNANATQLEQVIVNLANNAADAMPQGGKLRLATGLAQVEEERCTACGATFSGDYLRLEVSDTGEGMDAATLGHVFEPFYTTKETGRGTGLGLSTVFGIVKSYGGHIICQSFPGQGTSFVCYFPVSTQSVETDDHQVPASSTQLGSGQSILVVDDDEPVRDIAARFLRNGGYVVRTASSGEEALNILAEDDADFDLVILDLNMPGMGGVTCLEILQEEFPGQKVMVASGLLPPSQKEKIQLLGAAGFIEKPYLCAEFLSVLSQVLKPDPDQ
jgi:PAS domain S-box-containing protein